MHVSSDAIVAASADDEDYSELCRTVRPFIEMETEDPSAENLLFVAQKLLEKYPSIVALGRLHCGNYVFHYISQNLYLRYFHLPSRIC